MEHENNCFPASARWLVYAVTPFHLNLSLVPFTRRTLFFGLPFLPNQRYSVVPVIGRKSRLLDDRLSCARSYVTDTICHFAEFREGQGEHGSFFLFPIFVE